MAGATCMAMPDVCLTPTPVGPIPIPYPNIADTLTTLLPTAAETVLVGGFPSVVETSEILMSQGDDPGVAGGVVSHLVMGPVVFELGSLTVLKMGRGAARLGSMTGHNGMPASNMPMGVQNIPSPPGNVLIGP